MAESDSPQRTAPADPSPDNAATAIARAGSGGQSAGNAQPGKTVGRFFLLDSLGAGGMGVVWAAYDPQLDRKVALKFVRADSSGTDTTRLLREAQAIAQVSHPNVIAVHDVGSDGGQVYIAEEFVRGEDLSAWLRERPRELNEIIGVFLQAANGLAAAHAAGIIHRDFKPANVLVGEDGRVRVVDFGLARSELKSEPTEAAEHLAAARTSPLSSTLTETGAVMGTPLYMSPEQHLGQSSDARSDQFSFCASLYQALYGEGPFSGQTIAELGLEKARGAVRPASKGTKVPGWLREVLLKGLRAKPDDRYPSMIALIEALRHQSAINVRRLVYASIIGIPLVAAVIGGGYFVQQRQQLCKGAERKLIGIWDEPHRAAARKAFLATGAPYAERMLSSVETGLDAYGRDWISMHNEACEATRLRGDQSEDVLDLRMMCLSQRLQELKATTELLSNADSQVVEKAVQLVGGLSPLAACADIETLKAPIAHPKDEATRAKVEGIREGIAQAKALERAGKYSEGEQQADRAVKGAQEIHYGPVLSEALMQLGSLQMAAREDEAASNTLEDAFFEATASRHEEVASLSAALLITHYGKNLVRKSDGHRWARVAEAQLKRSGTVPALEAQLRRRVGDLLDSEGKYDEALAEFFRALAIQEAMANADPLEIATSHNNIGNALYAKGKFEEALAEYRRALSIREKVLGPEHPEVANSIANVGNVFFDKGRLDEALAEYRRALAIREKALGPDHPDLADGYDSLATALDARGKHEEALVEYRRGLAIREKALGPDHPDVADSLDNIGETLQALGKFQEALVQHRRALLIEENALGPDHPTTASSRSSIGCALEELGNFDEALIEYRRGLAIRETALGPDHPDVAESLTLIGQVLNAQGKYEEALAHYRRALAIREKSIGADHLNTAVSLAGVGIAELGLHSLDKAVTTLRRAIAVMEVHSAPDEDLDRARFALGRALWESNQNRSEAMELARKAREGVAKRPGKKRLLAEIDAWLNANRSKH